ncbi:sensor histidine kinase [Nocardioides glacieisoli]|uniref:sensor histidine kinase n=1 Tax=Nocardioides glacieisoli TaxID=1168730 RepID=UPI0013ED04AF|nr:HAMP domain-containing sensor histidine kinase [Nocardioides glacieisoli]
MGVLVFAVLAWTSWGGVPSIDARAPDARTLADGVVSGVFITGAVLAAVMGWRRHAQARAGRVVAVGALIAAQALLVALPAIANPPPRFDIEFATLLGICTTVLVGVLGAMTGLRAHRAVADDVFAVGLGMGFLAAGHLLLLIPQGATIAGPMQTLLGLFLVTHVMVAVVVVAHGVLPIPMAQLVAATVVVVAAGMLVIMGGRQGTAWDTVASLGLAAVGAAWLATAWECLHRGVDRAASRRQREMDLALQATTRYQREQLHELRSTVAGLVNGSELLEHAEIAIDARLRVWESVRRELARMQRLLSDEAQPVAPIDLDEALVVILELQRLKGRDVELLTTGDTVEAQARYDSLAEVLNILLDNAAAHGGTDSSVVEVVRSNEGTVDITVTDHGNGIPAQERERIFDWGERGPGSEGEGIGLNLAQRLLAEDGGSLRLTETNGRGSSFVISLPVPRRSIENDLADEDGHGSWRRSG